VNPVARSTHPAVVSLRRSSATYDIGKALASAGISDKDKDSATGQVAGTQRPLSANIRKASVSFGSQWSTRAQAGSSDKPSQAAAELLVHTDVVGDEMDDDYSSENSDYEYSNANGAYGDQGDPTSPHNSGTGQARTPRKSRKTRTIPVHELVAAGIIDDDAPTPRDDVIPNETNPVDERYSQVRHAAPLARPVPPAPPVPAAAAGSPSSVRSPVPPPKPPRRSSSGNSSGLGPAGSGSGSGSPLQPSS
jgi:hypothetical protein